MKTLKLAVAVVALTCLNARGEEHKYGVTDSIATAAIGGALGYIVEQQVYLNSQADKSTKMRKLGYGAQLTAVSGVTALTACAALGLCASDANVRKQVVGVALLSAIAVFTYNQKGRDNQNELYEAINDATASADAQAEASAA